MRSDTLVPDDLEMAILCGGLGTRLRTAVRDRPKPMVEVAGKPFLEMLLRHFGQYGVRRVILLTGYLGSMIADYFGGGEKWNLDIYYSQENEPLGTAGALKQAEPCITKDFFLVMNGDTFVGADPRQLIHFHQVKEADISVLLVRVENVERYGSVELGKDGRVLEFQEKGTGGGHGLINAGLYVFSRKVLEDIPAGRYVSLEQELLPPLVEQGRVFGMASSSVFIDIGIPETYRYLLKHYREIFADFLFI